LDGLVDEAGEVDQHVPHRRSTGRGVRPGRRRRVRRCRSCPRRCGAPEGCSRVLPGWSSRRRRASEMPDARAGAWAAASAVAAASARMVGQQDGRGHQISFVVKGLLRRGRARAASTVGQRVVVELAAEAAPAPRPQQAYPPARRGSKGPPRRRPVSLTHLARAGCPSPGGTRRYVGRVIESSFAIRVFVIVRCRGCRRWRHQRAA
jgi:hypothetical protein